MEKIFVKKNNKKREKHELIDVHSKSFRIVEEIEGNTKKDSTENADKELKRTKGKK